MMIGPTTRSTKSSSIKSKERTGVLEEKCIFCDKKEKKHLGSRQPLHLCLTTNIEDTIKSDAAALGDIEFLSRIEAYGSFAAKEVRYHQICRAGYSSRAKVALKKRLPKSEMQVKRELHEKAFELTRSFIEDKIILKEEVHKVDDLHQQYLYWLEELDENEETRDIAYLPHHLVEKIQKEMGNIVSFAQHPSKSIRRIIFKSTIAVEKALLDSFNQHKTQKAAVRDIANVFRREVKTAKRTPLPLNVTVGYHI